MQFNLRKGLSLPIQGKVDNTQIVERGTSRVAVLGPEYIGMKPSMLVKEGDTVQIGQPLFSCKKNEGLVFTAPAAGKVEAIHRGEKRMFQSLVIQVSGTAAKSFGSYKNQSIGNYERDEVCALLLESGEWASLRQRPFNKVADVGGKPHSVFINAMDTNPLAPNPRVAIEKWGQEFRDGVEILSKLTDGATYVACAGDFKVDLPAGAQSIEFHGPHPAGNVGTHIHFVDPVHSGKMVWHAGYQDVIAIGHLFSTGKLFLDRIVSLAGPNAKAPKYVQTQRGACISEIVKNEVEVDTRVIAGSVFNGRVATEALDYLGPYDNQISAIREDNSRELLGWQSPGFDKFSTKRIYLSKLMPSKLFNFGSSTHGSPRAMVPIGMFENVMPLDILPTQLLRSLVSRDVEDAQDLGCLELAEEDLALCTFVSPGKVDFGPILRANLDLIEREG